MSRHPARPHPRRQDVPEDDDGWDPTARGDRMILAVLFLVALACGGSFLVRWLAAFPPTTVASCVLTSASADVPVEHSRSPSTVYHQSWQFPDLLLADGQRLRPAGLGDCPQAGARIEKRRFELGYRVEGKPTARVPFFFLAAAFAASGALALALWRTRKA